MQLGLYIDISHASVLPNTQFDFIEENVQTLLVPEADEATFEQRLSLIRSLPKPVLCANRFLPADLKVVGPQIDQSRLVRWGEVAFRRAEQAGVKTIVWGSGASRKLPDGFPREQAREQFLQAVRLIAPLAEKHGVEIVIEPLSRLDSNFIRSLAEGAEIVEAADHASVRLLADFFHMMIENEPPEEIARFGKILTHVHLAEVKQRAVPGTHGDDFRPYLTALRKIGYNRAIVLEPEWNDVEKEPALGLQTLRGQMADAGLS